MSAKRSEGCTTCWLEADASYALFRSRPPSPFNYSFSQLRHSPGRKRLAKGAPLNRSREGDASKKSARSFVRSFVPPKLHQSVPTDVEHSDNVCSLIANSSRNLSGPVRFTIFKHLTFNFKRLSVCVCVSL